ncbi:hydrogenase maturation protease [Streptomyces albireticuli]|uniref:Hydrogenase maturation protease n=1 Tax=Streptomyces albireticuli TaxID=1940 RepID=A0A1Z2KXE1_9ACTN|nr:hydrogenase maturation protease [Streptomyces albireticuli]ARZ66700.1 hydrogenase maturation protease [Streptomyces albireticuli]
MAAVSDRITVIGVGNAFRRDDGAGPAVVARLRERTAHGGLPAGIRLVCCDGEPGRLIGLWEDAGLAVVVDAAHAHPGHPGRIHRLELDGCAAWQAGTASSHGLGLGEAVELARALDRMPRRLLVYAVEGADGSLGTGLTSAVAAAVGPLTERIEQEITHYLAGPHGKASSRSVRL